MKLTYYILPFISVLLFSCSNDKVMEEEKFVKVYTDLIIAEDTLGANYPVFDSVKADIFRRHNISVEMYDSTISYYNEDKERWERFFSLATAYIDTLKSGNPD